MKLAALILPLAFAALPAWAEGAQSREKIEAAAEQYLTSNPPVAGARLVLAAEPLDTRLNLRACQQPLVAGLPGNRATGPRVAVAVHCPDAGGWTVRVPVKVSSFLKVLVTTRPLTRGDGIGADDVRAEERDVATLGYGYVAELAQVDGRSLARPILAGTVLAPGMLAGRQAIRTGDAVIVMASMGGIVVRAEGVALSAGDNGARLRVRNSNSGKVLDAVVRGQGTVEVVQ
jgi:flagella basal body P-ring formation protein FlgA